MTKSKLKNFISMAKIRVFSLLESAGSCLSSSKDSLSANLMREGRSMTVLILKLLVYSMAFLAVIGDAGNLQVLGTASATAAAGGGGSFAKWLFDKKLIGGPPNTYHGCVLGPLAIGNAIINLKQRSSLKRTANQLKGVSASSAAAGAGAAEYDIMSPYYTTGPGGEIQWNIPDISVPCMDGGAGCAITNNGESLAMPSGQFVPLADISKNLPPETLNERMAVVEAAMQENKDLIANMQAAQQNLATNSRTVAGAAETAGNTPAFNFDPLGNQAGGGGSGSFAGSSAPLSSGSAPGGGYLSDEGGNTPALSAAPAGLYGDSGGQSEGAASAFAGGSAFSDGDSGGGVFGGSGEGAASFSGFRPKQSGGASGNTPPLSFGNDKIASADTNLFGAVRHRYSVFRTKGAFIPPASEGAVVRPSLPSSPASGGSGSSGAE